MSVKAPEGTVENALNILGYTVTDNDILSVDKMLRLRTIWKSFSKGNIC